MKNFLILIFSLICFVNPILSKNNKNSSHNVPSHRTCSTIMPSIEWENDFQQKIQQYLANHQNNTTNRELANYTIPVVVHVIYWDASQNISQAQVNSQITILNNDYAGTGLNANTVPAAFASRKANTNIAFCMAQKKPNGSTMTEFGIDRVNAQTAGFTNPSNTTGWSKSYIDGTIKPATIWDPTKYMNVWVLYITDGLLGYATFPTNSGLADLPGTGTSNTDGVVIGHFYFGNTGTVSTPYDKGRTATHEVGHWLGLRHISGDEECGNDFCGDTPPQIGNTDPADGSGLNYGCPTFPHQANSCSGTGSNGELFMDFMDYTDDACMYMFTTDQRTRMQTAMSNGTYRAPLASSTVCTSAPQAPIADFSAIPRTVCPGNTVQFSDASSNTPTSWSWSFVGGTPSTVTGTNAASKNPLITYNSAGTYAVTLTATNGFGSDGETKTSFITVTNPTTTALPLVQGFETATFPPTGWTLTSVSGFNWQRSTAVSGFGTSSASMRFDNSTNDAGFKKDDINTPVLNLSGVTNPRIKFDVAYAPYTDITGTYLDTIEVLVKNYCSGVTTSVYRKGGTTLATASATGNPFIPTSTQWRKDSVNIPANFLNTNIQVIFRNYGDFGNIVYVDNINIYGTTPATGTPAASFTASDSTVCKGNNLTFTSTSTSTIGSLDSIRWTILGGTPSSGTTTPIVSSFNTVANYIITLKAYKSGNVSTATKSIRVKDLPATPTISQRNDTLTCSISGTTYKWYRNGILIIPSTSIPKLKITQSGTYTVEVVSSNSCISVRSANFSASLTAVKNNRTDIQYSIVPNPNNGLFEIRITADANKIYQLKLYNISGQTLFSEEMNVKSGLNSKQLNIAGIEKGVYFLSLIGDDGISTQNIIVQ